MKRQNADWEKILAKNSSEKKKKLMFKTNTWMFIAALCLITKLGNTTKIS